MLNALIVTRQCLSIKVIDKKLFKKYTRIQERVSNLMNMEFDSEPVYGINDKCIKAKIKSYGNNVNANFQENKTPKANSSYITTW